MPRADPKEEHRTDLCTLLRGDLRPGSVGDRPAALRGGAFSSGWSTATGAEQDNCW